MIAVEGYDIVFERDFVRAAFVSNQGDILIYRRR